LAKSFVPRLPTFVTGFFPFVGFLFPRSEIAGYLCMIQIQNLSYSYSRRKTLFNGLNLQLPAGQVYGLLGKNGAGKSSLIKNIAGFLFPQKGNCLVNGFDPRKRESAFLEQLFYIPEACELPSLYIEELLNVYAPFYPAFNKKEFQTYLAAFHVDADSHLANLSFGQKKKTYVSFALAANTKLLIMDEPTNGLDIPSKLQFRNIVAHANREDKITIMSTHQVRDLDDLISSILIIDQGELLLYSDKATIGKKLFFEIQSSTPDTAYLYAESTPKGFAIVSENKLQQQSYLDIEIFFNATLAEPYKMKQAFATKQTSFI
jgi:ABC-2 type transport system ATP-binding protein